uniref:Carbonyl reductase 1 n=1 Tax=Electrophorus electricus TaxID=8005 RepID=A0AAY5EZ35_ELEEL
MLKRVSVVTGANNGIGLVPSRLQQRSVERLNSKGFDNVVFHLLNICDQNCCLELRRFLEKNYRGLDVLVNNAGIAFKVNATEPFGEQAEVTMHTNFGGTLARVVNVSSFVSKRSLDKCSPELQRVHEAQGWANTAYGTGKVQRFFIIAMLNETKAGDGILLNACCPGWVRMDMAGPNATKSPEEGAETPVYLALLPDRAKEPHGQLV